MTRAKKLRHSEDMYAIYPIAKALGWQVVIQRKGETVAARYFRVTVHGTNARALSAAHDYRDETIKRYPPLTLRERNQLLRSNNRTGFPGVIRTVQNGRPIYRALTMLPDGRQFTKQFSIAMHGEIGARELAIAERMRQLAQVEGVYLVSPASVELQRKLVGWDSVARSDLAMSGS